MSVIELGSLAGAMITVITLISKMISLITSIQNLINRLDTMQTELEANKHGLSDLTQRVNNHDVKLHTLEVEQMSLSNQVKELASYAFN
ncbi:hypothetical protein HW423_07350 [Aerococcaceae bacterium INB8]|uniref:Uncharacterized protein n=1 Tax=Ruoffia halotolerans TaxID=2748684 RepID=A0A839A6F4_9LACT|nr:hypothetical protein [Ruoffia halotolerans]MBA5729597.1 hypothetical protein [Ruoffia halotolerans]